MKKIGIVGTRRRNTEKDYTIVRAELQKVYEPGDWLVSGGCLTGGDAFAEKMARLNGIPILIFPAAWKRYGRAAGFIRNSDIANHSDVLIACCASDRKGGTEDTIRKFEKRGLTAIII